MAPPRDLQLDAARGLAVLLVLSGHLLQPVFYGPSGPEPGPALAVWRVIYAFHMPFFFLLCGMVDRMKGEMDLAAACASALKLVVVALTFSTLALIPRALDGTLSAADALRDALYGQNFGLGVLWFLVVLGLVRVIDAAARAAAIPGGYWIVLGGALALSWICSARAFPYWQVHALVGALPFYVAGLRLGRRAFDVSALLGACGLAVLLLCAPRNFVHVATGQYGDPALFAVSAVAGSAFMLAAAGRLRGPPRARGGPPGAGELRALHRERPLPTLGAAPARLGPVASPGAARGSRPASAPDRGARAARADPGGPPGRRRRGRRRRRRARRPPVSRAAGLRAEAGLLRGGSLRLVRDHPPAFRPQDPR